MAKRKNIHLMVSQILKILISMKTKLVLSGKVLNTLCIWNMMHTVTRLKLKCNHIRKMRRQRKKLWRHTHTKKNGLHNLLKEMKIDGTLSSVCPNCYKATWIWKFVQCRFKASKLNAGHDGHLDKIYIILVDLLDLKAGFPLANFFIWSNFFHLKTIKSRTGSYFFCFKKSC